MFPTVLTIARWFVMLGLVYFLSAFKENLLGKMETFLLMKQEKMFVMEPSIPDNIKLVYFRFPPVVTLDQ